MKDASKFSKYTALFLVADEANTTALIENAVKIAFLSLDIPNCLGAINLVLDC